MNLHPCADENQNPGDLWTPSELARAIHQAKMDLELAQALSRPAIDDAKSVLALNAKMTEVLKSIRGWRELASSDAWQRLWERVDSVLDEGRS